MLWSGLLLVAAALPAGPLPDALLERPAATAPSASCAQGVPPNQCLTAPAADDEGDERAAGQLLLSLDEFVEYVRDVASFEPASDATRRYLPVVRGSLEEVGELLTISEMEQMGDEILQPTVTSAIVFKHWCRRQLAAAATLCPRYVERLAQAQEPSGWHAIHDQLEPAVAFLTRLLDVWTVRFKRLRTQAAGLAAGEEPRPPLRVVVNGGGPAGLINAATAYTAGAEVTVLEKRRSYRRTVWFDLTSSQHILRAWDIHSPAQDILAAFGWGEQTTHAKHSGSAGIQHVRCAELERFLSKVLHFLGVAVRTEREGLALCPDPAMGQGQPADGAPGWVWVAATASTQADHAALSAEALCARLAAGDEETKAPAVAVTRHRAVAASTGRVRLLVMTITGCKARRQLGRCDLLAR